MVLAGAGAVDAVGATVDVVAGGVVDAVGAAVDATGTPSEEPSEGVDISLCMAEPIDSAVSVG